MSYTQSYCQIKTRCIIFNIYIVRDLNAVSCLVSASLAIFPVDGHLLLLRRGLRDMLACCQNCSLLLFLISITLLVLTVLSLSRAESSSIDRERERERAKKTIVSTSRDIIYDSYIILNVAANAGMVFVFYYGLQSGFSALPY
jgi:hypothetical protein